MIASVVRTWIIAVVRLAAQHGLTGRPAVTAEDVTDLFGGMDYEFGTGIRLGYRWHYSISLIKSPMVP